MRREVFQLSEQQARFVAKLDKSGFSDHLSHRLQQLIQVTEPIQLQLSQEEVEKILDLLPAPAEASEQIRELRHIFGQFLADSSTNI